MNFSFPIKAAKKKMFETYVSVSSPASFSFDGKKIVSFHECIKPGNPDPVKVKIEISFWAREKSNVFVTEV